MTIKQQGGIFGRNPTFNDVDVDNDLTVSNNLIVDNKLGVGTSSPDTGAKLTVNGGLFSKSYITAATTSAFAIDYLSGDSAARIIAYGPSTSNFGNTIFLRSDGTTTNESMRINHNGNVEIKAGNLVIGTSGNGIDFSATSDSGAVTSELLDDYEEGNWTPSFGATSGSFATLTMDVVAATYVKVGKQVTVSAFFRTDNVDTTGASGDLIVTGLPFTAAGSNVGWSAVNIGFASDWNSNTPLYGRVGQGAAYFFLCQRTAIGGADSLVTFADMTTGASADKNQLILSATYFTD